MRRGAQYALLLLAACHAREPKPKPGASWPEPVVREITVLYTSDEHGWVAAKDDRYAHIGGVSQLLAMLIAREGHCAGTLTVGQKTIVPNQETCASSRTVLLSGGDNYSGPAISTFHRGRTMADSMRLLGYRASAFGNHELDFGREQFLENRARAGVTYLAANLVAHDGKPSELAAPYVILEKGGVRLGVIGVATESTLKAAMAHRFGSIRLQPIESSVSRVVPEVWQRGADAVVLLAHECHDVIAPIVARHPEWRLVFVGTGHCHRSSVDRAGETLVVAPDWAMSHYARVRIAVWPERPIAERAKVVDYALVDVSSPLAGPPLSADAAIDRAVTDWQAEVDRRLGEVIGHSNTGMSAGSPEIGRWIVRSWRSAFADAELAVTTRGSIRQEVPPGPIDLATVHSILPFDNELVICEIPIAELPALLANAKAIFDGVSCSEGVCKKADGGSLSSKVRVVTTDFLYYGGDGFELKRFDPKPRFTGVDWRKPVIDWTRAARTTSDQPLEQAVRSR
jgi:2',3'-cyclic-nucleotide 2'-phosphodiesterase (5'-nucleotidase family)